jgi:hypothetical protein
VPADAPDPDAYFCPYCGEAAAADQWWTEQQVEMLQTTALSEALPQIQAELEGALEPLNRSGTGLQADVTIELPNPAAPLIEDDGDMVGVSSPCHPYEPVKILESWRAPIHCLVCGQLFII